MIQNKNKKRAITVGLYSMFILTLASSICGTFAWYTYGTRVPVRYNGISIGDYGSLEIGLESEYRLKDAEVIKYALTADYSIPGKNIYWCTGSFPGDTMAFMMQKNGYAYDYMSPTTAGHYDGVGDEFVLRNSPTYLRKYFGGQEQAKKDDYVKLNLVFRYMGDSGDDEHPGTYSTDYRVWLSSAVGLSGTDIHQGLRMYVEGADQSILINPNSTLPSTLIAGGALDLDNDGYYDYKRYSSPNGIVSREFAYGCVEQEDIIYEDTAPEEDIIVNEDPEQNSTFHSNSSAGVYKISNANQFPTINFEGMKTVTKKDYVLAYSDPFRKGYAFASITIYLEGWDHHVDNPESLQSFSFDLMFEAA